jgi:hypothetical protein
LEITVDVQEVRKLDAYLKRLFGNPKIRVVPRPKKDDSAEVYIGEEFIGVLFVDDEDDDRSFQFQMAILEKTWSSRVEASPRPLRRLEPRNSRPVKAVVDADAGDIRVKIRPATPPRA